MNVFSIASFSDMFAVSSITAFASTVASDPMLLLVFVVSATLLLALGKALFDMHRASAIENCNGNMSASSRQTLANQQAEYKRLIALLPKQRADVARTKATAEIAFKTGNSKRKELAGHVEDALGALQTTVSALRALSKPPVSTTIRFTDSLTTVARRR